VTRKLKRDLSQRNGARNQCATCGCQTVAVACIAALPLNQQTIALMSLPIHEITLPDAGPPCSPNIATSAKKSAHFYLARRSDKAIRPLPTYANRLQSLFC
jgi:hypothetical protein